MNEDDHKPIPLQGKIPIKNLHLVRDMQLFNNQQIYIIYDTTIHVYLIDKILTFLPSLVYVLDLQPIIARIQQQQYQDELTNRIVKTDKSRFGEIVFGDELNPESNALMSPGCFRNRVRFLTSNFVRIKSVNIHPLGHLLIVFQDTRSILLKRNNPKSLSPEYQTLLNTEHPILINTLLQSSILCSTLQKTVQQISILCIHQSSSKQGRRPTLSRIMETDKGELQVYHASKCAIDRRGIMRMSYVQGRNGVGWVLVLYYNRLEILEIGKFNNRNKSFQVLTHKQAQINQLQNKQHIINAWQYLTYSTNTKTHKLYLLKSSSIWQLQIIFNCYGQQQQHSNTSWNYKLTKSQKQPTTKSNVYYINFQGSFFEHVIEKDQHPNCVLERAVESDNGLLLRLQANPNNYKEGYLSIFCQSRVYMVQKSLQCVKAKQHGDIPWINFHDITYIKRQPEIKKSILKYLTTKTKQKQSSPQHPLINILVIGMLSITESKTQFLQNLRREAIRKQLPNQQFHTSHCAYSNRKIVTQDVVFCPVCHLYSIKDQVKIPYCYVCWGCLYVLD